VLRVDKDIEFFAFKKVRTARQLPDEEVEEETTFVDEVFGRVAEDLLPRDGWNVHADKAVTQCFAKSHEVVVAAGDFEVALLDISKDGVFDEVTLAALLRIAHHKVNSSLHSHETTLDLELTRDLCEFFPVLELSLLVLFG
jgi:hypothetical protein